VTHLLKTPVNQRLDGRPFIGQRTATFRFDIVDSVTGFRRVVNPIISGNAGINHDTRRTIKRMITGLHLGVADTEVFSSITSRLEPFMVIGGEDFPLGRYVPSDYAQIRLSRGNQSVSSFYDEGFIIDQQTSTSFGALSATGEVVSSTLQRFLENYPVSFNIELTDFTTLGSWSAGTRGGFILDQLALDGDYLSPWFDNSSVLQLIRTFNPAGNLPTFDYDNGISVLIEGIVETNNLINAPNRFIVIGNGADSLGGEIVGQADVPTTAPHSIANRGFVIADVSNRQVRTSAQAAAVAAALVQRQALIEETELSTLQDPRHDSYDIIHWREENWLEVAWTLPFTIGSPMTHVIQRTYA
jgi:hypothetical protein